MITEDAPHIRNSRSKSYATIPYLYLYLFVGFMANALWLPGAEIHSVETKEATADKRSGSTIPGTGDEQKDSADYDSGGAQERRDTDVIPLAGLDLHRPHVHGLLVGCIAKANRRREHRP